MSNVLPPLKKRRLSQAKGLFGNRVLFAVPKKGRLYDRVLKLLAGVGLVYKRANRLDIANCIKLPITLVFLPSHDIANYVSEGDCDLGITGQDIVAESNSQVKEILNLGFGKCKLCVQAPVGRYKNVKEIAGKRIVTSFPSLSKKFFQPLEEAGKPSSIRYVSGSVEAACSLGLAEAVVDLVETGTTMRAAGLEIVGTVMSTETILIGKKEPCSTKQDLIETLVKRIKGYLVSMRFVMVSYNVSKEALNKALKFTPGHESPSISDLYDSSWVSVSSLIEAKNSSQIMDDLQKVGARSILIFNMNNTRM